MQYGVITQKWHYNNIPDIEEILENLKRLILLKFLLKNPFIVFQ